MPKERTVSLYAEQYGDYSGAKAHSLRNGFTLKDAARTGSQASVVNAAIIRNAKVGVPFTAGDAFAWQKKENGDGRQTLKTLRDHL